MPTTARYHVYRERRLTWIRENGPCVRCGSPEDLQVDHIDPRLKDPRLRKSNTPLWAWSAVNREKELAKCQVLCASCHIKKSGEERRKPKPPKQPQTGIRKHGTRRAYFHHKCRCEVCTEVFETHGTARRWDMGCTCLPCRGAAINRGLRNKG